MFMFMGHRLMRILCAKSRKMKMHFHDFFPLLLLCSAVCNALAVAVAFWLGLPPRLCPRLCLGLAVLSLPPHSVLPFCGYAAAATAARRLSLCVNKA